MTVSFQQMFGKQPATDTALSQEPNSASCAQTPTLPVGEVSQDDSDREERIRHHKICMEAAMAEWEAHSCFTAYGQALYHRVRFEEEIKARSPEYVAKLERERGLM